MSKKGYVLYKEVAFFQNGEKVRTDSRRFDHTNFKNAREDMMYCMSFLSVVDGWDRSILKGSAIASHRNDEGYLDMMVTIGILSKGD